jgi:uncharacterized phage-like protein YoqJ
MEKVRKCCFIGHRHIGYGSIKERLEVAIKREIENGCRFFTMGTHGEFDSLALSTCINFRNEYKDIEIEVNITSLHKIKKQVEQDEFGIDVFIPYADVKTIMYDIEEEYFKKQITVSNRQMIDTCDTLICYVNKHQYRSGAKTAMNYAKKKGLRIVNLYKEEDEPTFGMTKEQKEEYWKKMFMK